MEFESWKGALSVIICIAIALGTPCFIVWWWRKKDKSPPLPKKGKWSSTPSSN